MKETLEFDENSLAKKFPKLAKVIKQGHMKVTKVTYDEGESAVCGKIAHFENPTVRFNEEIAQTLKEGFLHETFQIMFDCVLLGSRDSINHLVAYLQNRASFSI